MLCHFFKAGQTIQKWEHSSLKQGSSEQVLWRPWCKRGALQNKLRLQTSEGRKRNPKTHHQSKYQQLNTGLSLHYMEWSARDHINLVQVGREHILEGPLAFCKPPPTTLSQASPGGFHKLVCWCISASHFTSAYVDYQVTVPNKVFGAYYQGQIKQVSQLCDTGQPGYPQ